VAGARAFERKGLLLVVSGPSGAGKTTLCREIRAMMPGLRPSVSYTTRRPRPGEKNGREYFFVDSPTFGRMVEEDEFAEWAVVYGHRYGTPRKAMADMIARGIDVLLEIDVQGAMQIKARFPEAVNVYVLPPSIGELRRRLEQRAGDAPEEIARRLRRAREEVRSFRQYDYIVRNEDLKEAVKALEAIITAERVKTARLDIAAIEAQVAREFAGGGEADSSAPKRSAQKRGA
jgi:guanylate kinase